MPHPGVGFPVPPFEWPHVGRQWPAYNVESDQAEGLVMWMPYGGGYPGSRQHVDLVGGFVFTENGTPTWATDSERGRSILLDNGSSEYLSSATTPITAPPFTMCSWAYNDGVSGNQAIIGLYDTASGNNRFMLYFNGVPELYYFIESAAGYAQPAPISATANAWHHVCAVEAAADDHRTLLNGGSKKTSAVSRTPASIDTIGIGASADAPPDTFWSGRLSDGRIYDVAKTDSEIRHICGADDPQTKWELYQIPRRLWRLGSIAPPPPTAALPIFSSPDAIHSLVFGGVIVR